MKFLYFSGAIVFSLFLSGNLTAQNSTGASSSKEFKRKQAVKESNKPALSSTSTAHWKTSSVQTEPILKFSHPGFELVVNEINSLERQKKVESNRALESQLAKAYAKFKGMLEKELTKANLSATSKLTIENELNKLNK